MTRPAPVGGVLFWLTEWNWQPSILGGTILIIALYIFAVGPVREKFHLADEMPPGKALAFLLGVNLMFLSLFSALDELGDHYLFSAHMLQHLILSMVGPPLLLLGTPAGSYSHSYAIVFSCVSARVSLTPLSLLPCLPPIYGSGMLHRSMTRPCSTRTCTSWNISASCSLA